MAIVECDPLSAEKILKQEKISIGWSICRVFEYVHVFRCFKCGDYDHKATECKKEDRCLKCASKEHKTEDCVSDYYKCCNCIAANEKLKLNLKVDHTVFDANCPVYLRKVDAQKRSIKIVHNEEQQLKRMQTLCNNSYEFRICHQNVQCIRNKIDQLEMELNVDNIDIACFLNTGYSIMSKILS